MKKESNINKDFREKGIAGSLLSCIIVKCPLELRPETKQGYSESPVKVIYGIVVPDFKGNYFIIIQLEWDREVTFVSIYRDEVFLYL